MGYQIIREKLNAGFAIFSSITDRLVLRHGTPIQVSDWFARDAADKARAESLRIIGEFMRGKKPYFNFTMTIDEAEAKEKEVHGD